jgi:aryl-alcohol dehydrogenase-like predicted oxidoreductase
VSQVGLGTWPLAGNDGLAGYGPRDDARAEETIRRALEIGMSVFDTADVYGDGYAESLLGRLLTEHGDSRSIVITKGGMIASDGTFDRDPDALRRRVAASRDRLQRATIDVYLLHNPPPYLLGIAEIYR